MELYSICLLIIMQFFSNRVRFVKAIMPRANQIEDKRIEITTHRIMLLELRLKQDFVAAKKINDTLVEGYNLLFTENNPAGVKAFLHELGLIENVLRLPMVPLSNGVHQQIQNYLSNR